MFRRKPATFICILIDFYESCFHTHNTTQLGCFTFCREKRMTKFRFKIMCLIAERLVLLIQTHEKKTQQQQSFRRESSAREEEMRMNKIKIIDTPRLTLEKLFFVVFLSALLMRRQRSFVCFVFLFTIKESPTMSDVNQGEKSAI